MGLSNMSPGGGGGASVAPTDNAATLTKKPDFGDRLGSYFESRYPVAGGLANMVFGQNTSPQPVAVAPLAPMPQAGQQDTSMLAMNAQPKSGDGLKALLKLFL